MSLSLACPWAESCSQDIIGSPFGGTRASGMEARYEGRESWRTAFGLVEPRRCRQVFVPRVTSPPNPSCLSRLYFFHYQLPAANSSPVPFHLPSFLSFIGITSRDDPASFAYANEVKRKKSHCSPFNRTKSHKQQPPPPFPLVFRPECQFPKSWTMHAKYALFARLPRPPSKSSRELDAFQGCGIKGSSKWPHPPCLEQRKLDIFSQ